MFCHTSLYLPDVVREFYANWNSSITNPGSKWYKKIWVRGHVYKFSPEAINEFLPYDGGDFAVKDQPSWDEEEHDLDHLAYVLTKGK